MIERFKGTRGKSLLVSEMQNQKLLMGLAGAAEELVEAGELVSVSKDESIIEQGDGDNDVFFIVAGTFGVFVHGKRVATRYPGEHVGEMAAISPTQRRSASVLADEDGIVFRVPEETFSPIVASHAEMGLRIARELGRRLEQRNALIRPAHDKIRVFVISSAEALPIARELETAFAHDPFLTVVWSSGVFRVTNYTLESLENELEKSDFAVAVAHPDDQTHVRDEDWPTPRDNVIFELGFFMGRLGRQRAILMEPRGSRLKLPSDLAGITTIKYKFEKSLDATAMVAPACNELRKHIALLGRHI
jgi:predicted nucleotide-binding protein